MFRHQFEDLGNIGFDALPQPPFGMVRNISERGDRGWKTVWFALIAPLAASADVDQVPLPRPG